MVKLRFVSLECIHGIERTVLTKRTFVTICVHSILHEKLISENGRFEPVLIILCKKNSSETNKDVLDISFKSVPNLAFKLFHNPKLSLSTNHCDQHY